MHYLRRDRRGLDVDRTTGSKVHELLIEKSKLNENLVSQLFSYHEGQTELDSDEA